jgi:hypothetical protein
MNAWAPAAKRLRFRDGRDGRVVGSSDEAWRERLVEASERALAGLRVHDEVRASLLAAEIEAFRARLIAGEPRATRRRSIEPRASRDRREN